MLNLTLTENAHKAMRRFIQGSANPVEGVRIAVTGGGCSGLQYEVSMVEKPESDDTVVEQGIVKLFIDPESAKLLDGLTVDFVDSLDGTGFKFENPNAAASCGCGKSFAA